MSTSLRGGGAHKGPVLVRLEEVVGNKKFTLADVRTQVSGICLSIITDFLDSGDIKEAPYTSGDVRKGRYPKEYVLTGKNATVVIKIEPWEI